MRSASTCSTHSVVPGDSEPVKIGEMNQMMILRALSEAGGAGSALGLGSTRDPIASDAVSEMGPMIVERVRPGQYGWVKNLRQLPWVSAV